MMINVYQCKECVHLAAQTYEFCPKCRSKHSYLPIRVEGKGTVFSYTTIHVGDLKLKDETPYTVVVVECEEGLRLIGRMQKLQSIEVVIGSKVELSEWREGTPVFQIIK